MAAVVIELRRHKVELNVRALVRRQVAAYESARFRDVADSGTGARQQISCGDHQLLIEIEVVTDFLRALAERAEVEMILQIAPDLRAFGHRLYSQSIQFVRPPYPREHEQLRRCDRAGRQDHFTLRPRTMQPAAKLVLDADGASALKENPVGQTVRKDLEIGPPGRLLQISDGRAASPAAALCDLIEPHTVLDGSVEVRIAPQTALACGVAEHRAQRIAEPQVLDRERPADAVMLACAARLVLSLAKIRQHARVVPAVGAERSPFVIVERVAARITHRVDRAAAAEYPAARPVQFPA